MGSFTVFLSCTQTVIMNFVEEKLRKAFLRVNCSKGDEFIQGIKAEIEREQRRGREDKKIRYNIYCRWALQLMKAGVEKATYNFPIEALQFVREAAPKNVKGETNVGNYDVTMDVFCNALIKKANN